MKKKMQIIRTLFISSLVMMGSAAFAQIGSIAPTVIATAGETQSAGGITLSSNTGECNVITLDPSSSIILTQGFEQPSSDLLGNADNSCGVLAYSGLTPNGDGHNDLWIIDFVDLHPENTMEVYNRWGALVWKGTNYDNGLNISGNGGVVWNGYDLDGKVVPDGTYFFIFTTLTNGVESCSTKGWVEVSH